MCWTLFVKAIQNRQWSKMALRKLLHIGGILNQEKTMSEYQYKLSSNM